MTAAELKYQFDLRMKALLDVRTQLFDTIEVSRLLRRSEHDMLVRYSEMFDMSELETKVVSNLVSNFSETGFGLASSENLPNGYFVTLPPDIFRPSMEYAMLEGVTAPARVVPIKYDFYILNLDNPFRKPYDKLVWRLEYSGKHELITDGTALTEYRMRYIRKPADIDVDNEVTSELNENFHSEIVDGAVRLALSIIQSRSAVMQSPGEGQRQQRQQVSESKPES